MEISQEKLLEAGRILQDIGKDKLLSGYGIEVLSDGTVYSVCTAQIQTAVIADTDNAGVGSENRSLTG